MSTIQYNNTNNTNPTNNNTKKTMKPYCKVCHDSGKSEKEYTSHFVKSNLGPSGVVVCPTLLSQACTYCNKKGHTVKYCQSLKKQTKYEEEQEEQERKSASLFIKTKPKMSTNNNNKPKNTFAVLDDCTDDDEDYTETKTKTNTNTKSNTKSNTKTKSNTNNKNTKQDNKEEEFPALCTKSTTPTNSTNSTNSTTPTNSYASIVLTTPKVKQDTIIMTPMPLPIKKPIIMSNWADDWSDNEDDGPLTIEDLTTSKRNYYDIECDDDFSDSLSSYEDDYDDYDDEDRAHILDSVTCSNWRNFPRIHPYV
jgi:hypothetical protein